VFSTTVLTGSTWDILGIFLNVKQQVKRNQKTWADDARQLCHI